MSAFGVRLPGTRPYDPEVLDAAAISRLLDAAEAAAPVDAVEAVTREIGLRLDASRVSLLVLDTSGRQLVRLAHVPLVPGEASDTPPGGTLTPGVGVRTVGEDSALAVALDGGPLERVVRSQRVEVLPPDVAPGRGRWTVLAPVTERGEVLGVLELRLPREPDSSDVDEIGSLAHLLAFVLIANNRHTDLFEWGHRSRPLSLSAEIQQRLLPSSRTVEGGAFTLAGWLEPAADIAGDTFDYSVARDTLHLSMTDAMGHGVGASLTATLCVGALRGSRRRGLSLTEQSAEANAAVAEHGAAHGLDDFVTGLVGRVDLHTGTLQLVNAGHVAPFLARGTEVRPLRLPRNLPFGMFPDTVYESAVVPLEPGDRILLVTDGMLERDAAAVDLPAAIRASRSLHPREVVAALADSVLDAVGHALSDDATVLCLDWYGSHGGDRITSAGADVARASSAAR